MEVAILWQFVYQMELEEWFNVSAEQDLQVLFLKIVNLAKLKFDQGYILMVGFRLKKFYLDAYSFDSSNAKIKDW